MVKLAIFVLAVAALSIAGCSKPDENPAGYTKEDFKKTGPPPQWRGPGQPGAPSSGPAPNAVPPATAGGGQTGGR